MSDVILINSFPNSKRKINILKEQISNLKPIGLPIILCSGCDIQKDIYDLVDYVFLNKEKIIKPALFQKDQYLNGKSNVCFLISGDVHIFSDNVDLTITRNIKMLFKIAQGLGFTNALYTEDDFIINNLKYVNDSFNHLKNKGKKMVIIKNDNVKNICTSQFFANIDFFIKNFWMPENLDQLNNEKVKNELDIHMTYEDSFARCFWPFIQDFHINRLSDMQEYIKNDLIFSRFDDLNFLCKNVAVLGKDELNNVFGFFSNFSDKNILDISVKVNNEVVFNDPNFFYSSWFRTRFLKLGDTVEFTIRDAKDNNNCVKKKIIYNSDADILAFKIS